MKWNRIYKVMILGAEWNKLLGYDFIYTTVISISRKILQSTSKHLLIDGNLQEQIGVDICRVFYHSQSYHLSSIL